VNAGRLPQMVEMRRSRARDADQIFKRLITAAYDPESIR
jgi:hypothetical protein